MEQKNNMNIIIGLIAIVLMVIIGWIVDSSKKWEKIESQTLTWNTNQVENTQTWTVENANINTFKDSIYWFQFQYPDNFFDIWHEPSTIYWECNYEVFPKNCPDISNIVVNWSNSWSILNINNVPFCLYISTDAAMWHIYNSYYYTTIRDDKCFIVSLDTSKTNCDFYLPLEEGNTEQKQNYESCITKNQNQPWILNDIVNSFKFIK